MAQTPFSLLLLRRLSVSSKTGKSPQTHFNSLYFNTKPFSTSPFPLPTPNPSLSDSQAKPSLLSARMSFIFEQIDQIEKQKHENDGTLQRIPAWRQSKQQQNQETVITQKVQNPEVISSVKESPERYSAEKQVLVRNEVKEVELVHPWPEWIELMERLLKQNYFDHRRKDEDKMVKDLGFEDGVEESDIGIEFDNFRTVQTACINFGKDRWIS